MRALTASRRREIAELRLINQGLVDRPFATPLEAVTHLVCLQGQHLPGVLAAPALRVAAGTRQQVIEACNRGELVRGYPMRGTVFMTAASDLAWMTELTRDRQRASAAKRFVEHGFTEEILALAAETARAALAVAGGSLSREAVAEALGAAGIALDSGQRYHLLVTLMVRGDLAYGPLIGSDQLLVDAHAWLPDAGTLEARFNGDEDAAITEWLRRYLAGHGPATLRDFSWWTKLPLGRLRKLEATATTTLVQYGEDALGETLWGPSGLDERRSALGAAVRRGRLLPAFDEVVLGYPDRELIVDAEHHQKLVPGNNGVFQATAHRDGKVVGIWKPSASKPGGEVPLIPFAELPAVALREFAAAYRDYPHPN